MKTVLGNPFVHSLGEGARPFPGRYLAKLREFGRSGLDHHQRLLRLKRHMLHDRTQEIGGRLGVKAGAYDEQVVGPGLLDDRRPRISVAREQFDMGTESELAEKGAVGPASGGLAGV